MKKFVSIFTIAGTGVLSFLFMSWVLKEVKPDVSIGWVVMISVLTILGGWLVEKKCRRI
ncbi:MAG: hypothetical protein WCV85_02620 [Patescibacteria group bacterium]|jgi:hypothetical protein